MRLGLMLVLMPLAGGCVGSDKKQANNHTNTDSDTALDADDTGKSDDTATADDTGEEDTGEDSGTADDTGEDEDTGTITDALGCAEGSIAPTDWEEPDDLDGLQNDADTHWTTAPETPLAQARLAVIDAGVWLHSGDEAYADHAWERLQPVVEWWPDASTTERNDLVLSAEACWSHAWVYQTLVDGGYAGLTESFSLTYKDLLQSICSPRHRGNSPEALARAAGTAMALHVFPDLDVVDSYESDTPDEPFEGDWSDYTEDVWSSWRVQSDVTANDLETEANQWMSVLHLADLRGWSDELLESDVEQVFARVRDQMEPSGRPLAESGAWATWVALLERAGSMYGHSGYRWAAQRIRQSAASTAATSSMHGLIWAETWKDTTVTPHAPDCGSVLSTRRLADGTDVTEKLVLAQQRQPDSPFVKMEMYEESHGAYMGSLLSFQVNGIDYIDPLETQRMDPFALEQETRFNLEPVAGEWQHAKLPTNRLPGYTPGSSLRHLVYLRFKLSNFTDDDIQLTLDNVRLTGPSGELMVEAFDDRDTLSTGWRAAEFTTDCVEGSHAAMLPYEPGTRSHHGGWDAYDVLFDTETYPYIEIDWKVPETAETTAAFLAMETQTRDETGEASWGYDWLLAASASVDSGREITTEVTASMVETKDEDSYGQVTFHDYVSIGTTLTRRMVLTAEGALVVSDTIEPCAECGVVNVGPLWQLPTDDVPEVDGNVVSATGFIHAESGEREDDSHLLVAFEPDVERTVDVGLSMSMSGDRHRVSTQQIVRGGERTTMMSVLLPHDGTVDTDTLTEGFVWPGVGEVVLPAWGTSPETTVRFGDDDSWAVER